MILVTPTGVHVLVTAALAAYRLKRLRTARNWSSLVLMVISRGPVGQANADPRTKGGMPAR